MIVAVMGIAIPHRCLGPPPALQARALPVAAVVLQMRAQRIQSAAPEPAQRAALERGPPPQRARAATLAHTHQ